MKVGTKLIAIDPCVTQLESGAFSAMYTVGKSYSVDQVYSNGVLLINERGNPHIITNGNLEKWFKIEPSESITPESLEELGFERTSVGALRKNIGDVCIDYDYGSIWIKIIDSPFTALPNCRNLTDLKHLIRILGV